MEIPLFPLPLVLFPQAVVPLHIFEERYRLMINHCIENFEVFGIVLIPPGTSRESESTIRRVGVTARIVQHERLADGRLNITAAGETRFRILRFTGNNPYWTAEVELFEDDLPDGRDESEELLEVQGDVVRAYREVHQLAAKIRGVDAVEIQLPESAVALSYKVSSVLGVAPEASQDLLEMMSTTGRLKSLYVYLEEVAHRLNAQIGSENTDHKGEKNGHWVN